MAGAARAVALAGALCLLAACQDEPDFDERYEAAQTKIREKAAELDAELDKATREQARDGAQGVANSATERRASDRPPEQGAAHTPS